jgi:TrmH family RNA methyltransferase
VQDLRALVRQSGARRQQRRFVTEGPKLVSEALAAGVVPDAVYFDDTEAGPVHRDLADRSVALGAQVIPCAPGVLARACDAVTPQPIAAIVPMVDVPLESLASEPAPPIVLVCVSIQDPGNAGTIVRSAAAAGGGAVIFTAGAVDIYNPKAVRASAGAIFHTPVVTGPEPRTVLAALARWGMCRLAATARGGIDYTSADLARRTALVLGSESHGLPESLAGLLDGCVSIPMATRSESLNVAMAATVICFEAARQRRGR